MFSSGCCALYSATGVIFTLYIGVLLVTQPFLIAGIEDHDTAQASAFGASGLFLFTFLASLGGMWYDSTFKKEPMNGDIQGPEADYHLSQDVPASYGTAS